MIFIQLSQSWHVSPDWLGYAPAPEKQMPRHALPGVTTNYKLSFRRIQGLLSASGPGCAGGIEIGPHRREVGHVAGRHAFERSCAPKVRVRPLKACRGRKSCGAG